MTRLTWDGHNARPYEFGVDRGVLYPQGSSGVAWNGLVSVKEASEEGDVTESYYNGQRYRQYRRAGGFAATLEAFTYPVEFEAHDGFSGNLTQQRRKPFGLSYRTMNGASGYKIHLVYNALTAPSSLDHETMDDETDAATYIWGISTSPIPITGAKASSHLIIDSMIAYPAALAEFEDLLYGSEAASPVLPSPEEVIAIFEAHAILRIIDHGDGTWTAIGPDSAIEMLDATMFQITWPSAVYIDDDTYRISSL